MNPETLARVIQIARDKWHEDGQYYHGDILTAHNAKLTKTEHSTGARVVGISLWPGRAPHVEDNGKSHVICPNASKGCVASCLGFSGLAGAFPETILVSRILKTWHFIFHRVDFVDRALTETGKHAARARADGVELYLRPDIVSDICWHLEQGLFFVPRAYERFGTKSYGYTKRPGKLTPGHPHDTTPFREFYRLVFSRSESNESDCSRILQSGGDVSVVFHTAGNFAGRNSALQTLPTNYDINGVRYRVIDGDSHDLRGWKDPVNRGKVGRIIGLRLKGNTAERQAAIDSGFSLPVRP